MALPLGVFGRLVQRLTRDGSTVLGAEVIEPRGAAGFSNTDLLLFDVVDTLNLANWQRQGSKATSANRPRPVSPLAKQAQTKRHGQTDQPPHKVLAILRKLRPPRAED